MQKPTSSDTGTGSFLKVITGIGDEAMRRTLRAFKKSDHSVPAKQPTKAASGPAATKAVPDVSPIDYNVSGFRIPDVAPQPKVTGGKGQ